LIGWASWLAGWLGHGLIWFGLGWIELVCLLIKIETFLDNYSRRMAPLPHTSRRTFSSSTLSSTLEATKSFQKKM
jgi:hypothetical protein